MRPDPAERVADHHPAQPYRPGRREALDRVRRAAVPGIRRRPPGLCAALQTGWNPRPLRRKALLLPDGHLEMCDHPEALTRVEDRPFNGCEVIRECSPRTAGPARSGIRQVHSQVPALGLNRSSHQDGLLPVVRFRPGRSVSPAAVMPEAADHECQEDHS